MVTETTLDVIDVSLFENVNSADNYIPNFLRVMSSSMLAKTTGEWSDMMTASNSGTYSSQWMVVDYNKFKEYKDTKNEVEGLFLVLEQVPGSIISHDVSSHIYKVLIIY